jgi:hypothetical protein
MKNIEIFTILIIVLFIGCSEDFIVKSPPDRLSEEGFFNDQTRALQGVNATYIPLASGYMHGNDDNGMRLFDPPTGETVLGASISSQVFNNFTYLASDEALQMFYSGCYQGIRRANIIIRDVPNIDMDASLKARYIGEVKFLRALYYWYLTTMFGEVPLFTDVLSYPEDALVAKSSISSIYTVMIQDLKDAIQSLPDSYSLSEIGRATKGAAKALLGKVYLYDKDYVQAESMLKEIIESGQYELMDDFDHVWNRNFENNKETLFEVQFASAQSGATGNVGMNDKHYWVQINGGLGEFVPTQKIVDAFEPGDPRLDYSIFHYDGQPFGPHISANLAEYQVKWSATGYGVRKGLVPLISPLTPDANGTNLPIIRYADVLLMYAEAANELDMIEEARDAINQVRQRPSVNMPILTSQNTGTKQSVFEAIVKERQVELAFERHRFNDLKRWELASTILADKGYLESRHRYFPLPQLEVDINPNLVQLPGW